MSIYSTAFVESGDHLFILSRRPNKQLNEKLIECDEMYASVGHNIYFAKPRKNVVDHKFVIAKEAAKLNALTVKIREGDILTIETLRFSNQFVTKNKDNCQPTLVCRNCILFRRLR